MTDTYIVAEEAKRILIEKITDSVCVSVDDLWMPPEGGWEPDDERPRLIRIKLRLGKDAPSISVLCPVNEEVLTDVKWAKDITEKAWQSLGEMMQRSQKNGVSRAT